MNGTPELADEKVSTEVIAHVEPVLEKTHNGVVRGARRSERIGKLVAALCKAQLEFAPVIKRSINPQFRSKYADLATVIDATIPALSRNELAVIQTPFVEGTQLTVTTMLVHSSDEWISSELTLPATMRDTLTAQTIGTAISYARRYALQSILGVGAEDDDGMEASGGGTKEAAQTVAAKKIEESGVVPSLFYVWHDESQTAEITGAEALKTANRDLLKPFWNATAGALVCTGEQLEGLKYELEKRGVPFSRIGAPPLVEQLKESVAKVAKNKKL